MTGAISVLFPEQPVDPRSVNRWARLVDKLELSRLWMGQSFQIESHLALAAMTTPVPVGVGTALAPLRTPYDAALQARSLAAVLGRSVTIAYGASDPGFLRSVTGERFVRRAAHTAAYVEAVRKLLDGGHVRVDRAGVFVDGELPPMRSPEVQVGAGVLRPQMAAKASAFADVVVTWLTPPNYVARVLVPALRRPDGTHPRIVSYVQCAVERPGRNGAILAQLGAGNHLTRHHYVDMLHRSGLDVHPSDPSSGARELVRHGVFVYGSPSSIAESIARHRDSGVDEVVINVTGTSMMHGGAEAERDLEDIVAACGANMLPREELTS